MSQLCRPRENVSFLSYTGSAFVTIQLPCRESLPGEDPETQATLMGRVLEILLEIESLTPTERVSIQENLGGLRPHTEGNFTQSGQQRYVFICLSDSHSRNIADHAGSASTLDSIAGSETFNELSSLIPIRFRHQSEEEASAVRVTQTRSTQVPKHGNVDSSDESRYAVHPHSNKAVASQESERWKLLKKIHEVVKVTSSLADSAQGESTGLNRRNRWTTEKVAAGSSIYATSDHTTSGNVANAQATARRSAQSVSILVLSPLPCSLNF